MDAIKKNLTILFAFKNKQNGTANVHDNRTVNLSTSVLGTKL